MEREIDLKEISDGRLYSSSDMVKQTAEIVKAALPVVREWDPLFYWIPMTFTV